MSTLTLLLIGGLTILAIARYNKSNKLFWQLFISFLFGVTCGYVGHCASNSAKKEKIIIIKQTPMCQSSVAIQMPDFGTVTEEIRADLKANYTVLENAYEKMVTSPIVTIQLPTFNPELDIGLFDPFDTS